MSPVMRWELRSGYWRQLERGQEAMRGQIGLPSAHKTDRPSFFTPAVRSFFSVTNRLVTLQLVETGDDVETFVQFSAR